MGYKGLIQLAIRTGYYKKINVLEIKKGELVSWNRLTEEIQVNFIEDEDEREKLETIGFYVFYESMKGFQKAIYWSKKKMEIHAKKYSSLYRDYNKGQWVSNFDEMAKKTMLKQLLGKWGTITETYDNTLAKAIESDMAVIEEDGSKIYVDNLEEKNTNENEYIEVKEYQTEVIQSKNEQISLNNDDEEEDINSLFE